MPHLKAVFSLFHVSCTRESPFERVNLRRAARHSRRRAGNWSFHQYIEPLVCLRLQRGRKGLLSLLPLPLSTAWHRCSKSNSMHRWTLKVITSRTDQSLILEARRGNREINYGSSRSSSEREFPALI